MIRKIVIKTAIAGDAMNAEPRIKPQANGVRRSLSFVRM